MKPTTALIIAAVGIAGIYAFKQYQAAKAKEEAAGQWTSVLGLGKKLLGWL